MVMFYLFLFFFFFIDFMNLEFMTIHTPVSILIYLFIYLFILYVPSFHQTDLVFVNKWRPSLKMVTILDCLVISMYSEIAYYVLLM